MNDNLNDVLKLINEIKKIHDRDYIEVTGDMADSIFQYRYCYYFALLLQKFYPNGELYMKNDGSHVVLKIDDYLYDSMGSIFEYKSDYHPFREEDLLVLEISMLPKDEYQRQKMNNFVNEMYEKIKNEYLNKEENKIRR